MVSKGGIAKEAIPRILSEVAKNPDAGIAKAVEKSGVGSISAKGLDSIIDRILKEKKELLSHPRREKVLMGLVMKEARGKVDGKTVMDTLIKKLKKFKKI